MRKQNNTQHHDLGFNHVYRRDSSFCPCSVQAISVSVSPSPPLSLSLSLYLSLSPFSLSLSRIIVRYVSRPLTLSKHRPSCCSLLFCGLSPSPGRSGAPAPSVWLSGRARQINVCAMRAPASQTRDTQPGSIRCRSSQR